MAAHDIVRRVVIHPDRVNRLSIPGITVVVVLPVISVYFRQPAATYSVHLIPETSLIALDCNADNLLPTDPGIIGKIRYFWQDPAVLHLNCIDEFDTGIGTIFDCLAHCSLIHSRLRFCLRRDSLDTSNPKRIKDPLASSYAHVR